MNAATVAIIGVLVSAIAAFSSDAVTPAPAAALVRAAPTPSTIAFVAHDGIFTVRTDGSHLRRIAAQADDPAWSPDGRYIAYRNYGDANCGIFVARADGTRRRCLTNSGDYGPAWSPDGRRIVVHREGGDSDDGDLFVVEVSTRRVVRLTRTPDVAEFEPAWSPDGREIVFVGDFDIQVLKLRTQQIRTVVAGGGRWAGFLLERPHWSPNGTQIAYSTSVERGYAIVVMKADGSNRRGIITSRAGLSSPSWSPDGTRIAYSRSSSGEGANRRPGWLFIARPDGRGQHALVRDGGYPDWRPR